MQTNKSQNYKQFNSIQPPDPSKTSQSNTIKSSITPYNIGQILTGEVIDLARHEITILLSNGQTLKGRMEDASSLSISDMAKFVVDDLKSSKLILKLLSKAPSITPDHTVEKALEEANLVKSERNINVVKELLKQQMPIDKNTIQAVLRQATMFKNTSIETIVLMNRYQIPFNETNTSQLEAYRNFEHQLLTQVQSLSASIGADMLATPLSATSQQELISLFMGNDIQSESNMNQIQNETQTNYDVQNLSSQAAQNKASGAMQNTSNDVIQDTSDEVMSKSSDIAMQSASNEVKQTTLNAASLSSLTETNTQLSHNNQSNIQSYDHTTLLSDSNLNTLQEALLNKTTIPHKETSQLDPSKIKSLLVKSFTLSINQLQDSNGLSQFYEKAEEKLEALKQFFTQLAQTSAENSYKATNTVLNQLKDSFDFMKIMNQFFGYVQIPMKLPNQYTNSELFVYTNKKQLREGNKNLSVLLHLNMEYLGPIDFHLTLFQQKVTAKVSLVNEVSISLISQHIPQLQEALKAKGYTFDYQIQKTEEETNVVKSFFDQDSLDLVMKRYSFDKRA